MALTYQLSDLYLSQNPKKALELGLQANRMAIDQGNKSMAARTAFLVAQAYEYQKDTRNQEVWLKNALTYAKQAGDSDLIIRSVEKRSQIAVKDRNYRRAYEINQEALSISTLKERASANWKTATHCKKLAWNGKNANWKASGIPCRKR